MLVEILARFQCDVCGKEFPIEIDPARNPPAGWSIFEVAEDSIRGTALHNGGMVVDGNHLCDQCGRKAEKKL